MCEAQSSIGRYIIYILHVCECAFVCACAGVCVPECVGVHVHVCA